MKPHDRGFGKRKKEERQCRGLEIYKLISHRRRRGRDIASKSMRADKGMQTQQRKYDLK